MTFTSLGPDPLQTQIDAVLARLAAGELPQDIERAQVDFKEEPGRRAPGGVVQPGKTENEDAAKYLAEEMACMANTRGGGAIIVGVADKGGAIGTRLDGEWLRHRLFELTAKKLTVTVGEVTLDDKRLLVLTTAEAIEPIRYRGKVKWRVDDNCVEVDATTWHAGRFQRTVDWSAQPSGHKMGDVSSIALELARRYLKSGGSSNQDLADADDHELVRRLNLIDGDGHLTNAGSLLLVTTPDVGIDYIRRETHGGDSTNRLQAAGPLIEQLADVEKAAESANRIVHVPNGLAHSQRRAIPTRALREAIVNGVVHRDWHSPQPTLVEHVGDELIVSSPGGFLQGISPENIITHPALPRYRSLAETLASLNLAEREGVGVDRMVLDMLATGRPKPEITEMPGPYVRVALAGGDPDPGTLEFLAAVEPVDAANAVDTLLLLDLVLDKGWFDAATAAPVVQRPVGETRNVLDRLVQYTVGGQPLIIAVKGVPADADPAYRLGSAAAAALDHRRSNLATPAGRRAQILHWATARGRASSTEIADLTDITVPYAGTLLTALEKDGLLEGSRPNRRGAGFFYRPVGVQAGTGTGGASPM